MTVPVAGGRPRYRDGQRLTAELLQAEQSAMRAGQARHASRLHRPGVVCGLAVEIDPQGAWVSPGAAVEPGGAILTLPERRAVSLAGIGTASHATVLLRAAEASGGAARSPLRAGLAVVADSSPPASPPAPGEVVIGALERQGSTWRVGPLPRPETGLTAVALSDNASDTQVRLEAGAVEVVCGGARLFRSDASRNRIDGGVAVKAVAAGALAFQEAPPTPPGAWKLGRSAAGLALSLPPGGRFVVGIRRNKTFEPLLVVTPDGRLAIPGALDVSGRLSLPPVPADPSDPRFAAALNLALAKTGAVVAEAGVV